jgi:hypothetical protein
MFALTIAGFLVFFLRSRGFGLPVLAVVEVANVVALIGLQNQHGYDVLNINIGLLAVPVIGLLLLAVLWRYSAPALNKPKGGPTCRIAPSVPVTANVFSTLDHTCCC